MANKHRSSVGNWLIVLAALLVLAGILANAFHAHAVIAAIDQAIKTLPALIRGGDPFAVLMVLAAPVVVFFALFLFGWLRQNGPVWDVIAALKDGSKKTVLEKALNLAGLVAICLTIGFVSLVAAIAARPTQYSPPIAPPQAINTPAPTPPPPAVPALTTAYEKAVADGKFDEADRLWGLLQKERLPSDSLPNEARADHCATLRQYDEAAKHYRLALKHNRSVHNLAMLAICLTKRQYSIDQLSDAQEAVGLAREAETLARKVDNAADLSLSLHAVGQAFWATSDLEAAKTALLAAKQFCPQDDKLSMADIYSDLATCYDNSGQSQEADQYYELALKAVDRLHPGDSGEKALIMANRAACLKKLGQLRRAITLYRDSERMLLRVCGCASTNKQDCSDLRVAFVRANLSLALIALGSAKEAQEAEEYARAAYSAYFTQVDEDNRMLALVEGILAHILMQRQACTPEAEKFMRSALTKSQKFDPGDSLRTAMAMSNLGVYIARCAANEKRDETEQERTEINTLFEGSSAMVSRLNVPCSLDGVWVKRNAGSRFSQEGQRTSNRELCERAVPLLKSAVDDAIVLSNGNSTLDLASALHAYGMSLVRVGRFAEALAAASDAVTRHHETRGGESADEALSLAVVARCHFEMHNLPSALEQAQKAEAMANRMGRADIGKTCEKLLQRIRDAASRAAKPNGENDKSSL